MTESNSLASAFEADIGRAHERLATLVFFSGGQGENSKSELLARICGILNVPVGSVPDPDLASSGLLLHMNMFAEELAFKRAKASYEGLAQGFDAAMGCMARP